MVRPTTAVLKYDTQLADPVAVGRELKADAILEGRVRASKGTVQVSVRLLKVPNGELCGPALSRKISIGPSHRSPSRTILCGR